MVGILPIADNQVSVGFFLIAAALAPIGVVVGAAVVPLSERIARRDSLKSYKRNVYRNFLDHAYWYRRLPDGDERQKRAVKYVADWHRIQLITEDAEVLAAVEGLQQEGSLTEKMEPEVLRAFKNEVGTKGLTEP
jgi:hypothetical protein